MKKLLALSALLVMLTSSFLSVSLLAQDEDLYSFEVEEFSKQIWEWKRELSLSGSSMSFNQESLFYPFKFQKEKETQAQELRVQMLIESRWDWDWSRLYLVAEGGRTVSTLADANERNVFLREGYWQLSTLEPHSFEVGKRLLRWGKGYAFNPVALLERPKNPENPEAGREGLWVFQGVVIPQAFSGLDSNSVTLVYLPVRQGINDDYESQLEQENIWGLKLSALLGTTDLDFYLTRWSEKSETDWGFDFASNLSSNFEVHGEYAADQVAAEKYGKSLLGVRYLTDSEITWTIEAYRDTSGWTKDESTAIYQTIKNGSASAAKSALNKLQEKQIINQNYAYVKASFKEPFSWLYFTPSLTWLGNLDDQSSNVITQLNYAPVTNWGFQVSWQQLSGSADTQYGENLVGNKLDFKTTRSF
ncbi:MAG: hypothetical protein H8E38_07060 [SAR324 cluster bacterium]|nr:hypothetical protein [SAR324 cluster bacterium]